MSDTTTNYNLSGIGFFRPPGAAVTVNYKYAFPEGSDPNHASRWSHDDERDVREWAWRVEPGDTVYDVGSAFGSYILCAMAAGAAGGVAINPSPPEQQALWRSLQLNGWHERVTLFERGLWSRPGWLSDFEQEFTEEVPTDDAFRIDTRGDGTPTQRFRVTSLDSLAIAHPPGRSIMKLDVEGAELEVLKGALRFFQFVTPAIVVVEEHVFKDAGLGDKVEAQMRDYGYRCEGHRPYHSVQHGLYVPE